MGDAAMESPIIPGGNLVVDEALSSIFDQRLDGDGVWRASDEKSDPYITRLNRFNNDFEEQSKRNTTDKFPVLQTTVQDESAVVATDNVEHNKSNNMNRRQ